MNRRIMKKVLREHGDGRDLPWKLVRAAYVKFWNREYGRIWRLQYMTKTWPVTREGRWSPLRAARKYNAM